jgi:chloramphenicol O-acetyltransferase
MENSGLTNFQTITKFVGDLNTEFGNRQHSLQLYNRLLDKTKITHVESINRHISVFRTFIFKNKDRIINKDSSLIDPVISYSKKVNIKMDEIFKMADSDTTEIIWKHLLVMLNSFDPSSGAMNVLKKSMSEDSNEGKFLNNLVQKIEQTVDPNTTDPMSAIMGMMSSGAFTDILSSMNSGIQQGSLDMGKLFSTVQGIVGTMGMPPIVPESKSQSSDTLPS